MQSHRFPLLLLALLSVTSRAAEPVYTEPPCNKVAIQLNDGSAPILATDSYFAYHFDYALSSLQRLETLATIDTCSSIVQRLESPYRRRKSLRELAEASPEPYRNELLHKLHRPQSSSGTAWMLQSLNSEHEALVQQSSISATEACAVLWGRLSNSQSDHSVTAENRIRVELPQCLIAPTKTFRQPS